MSKILYRDAYERVEAVVCIDEENAKIYFEPDDANRPLETYTWDEVQTWYYEELDEPEEFEVGDCIDYEDEITEKLVTDW